MIYHPYLGLPHVDHLAAWIWMLSEARPTAGFVLARGRVIHLKRGQFCHPIRFMALCCGMSTSKLKEFLAVLNAGELIETHTDGGRLVTTICNYDEYSAVGCFTYPWNERGDDRRNIMEAYKECASQSIPWSDEG
jgi:hypothetical protein